MQYFWMFFNGGGWIILAVLAYLFIVYVLPPIIDQYTDGDKMNGEFPWTKDE